MDFIHNLKRAASDYAAFRNKDKITKREKALLRLFDAGTNEFHRIFGRVPDKVTTNRETCSLDVELDGVIFRITWRIRGAIVQLVCICPRCEQAIVSEEIKSTDDFLRYTYALISKHTC